jgi:hypothetical protein
MHAGNHNPTAFDHAALKAELGFNTAAAAVGAKAAALEAGLRAIGNGRMINSAHEVRTVQNLIWRCCRTVAHVTQQPETIKVCGSRTAAQQQQQQQQQSIWPGSAAEVQQLQCQLFVLLLSCTKVAHAVWDDTAEGHVQVMGMVYEALLAGRGVSAATCSSSSSSSSAAETWSLLMARGLVISGQQLLMVADQKKALRDAESCCSGDDEDTQAGAAADASSECDASKVASDVEEDGRSDTAAADQSTAEHVYSLDLLDGFRVTVSWLTQQLPLLQAPLLQLPASSSKLCAAAFEAAAACNSAAAPAACNSAAAPAAEGISTADPEAAASAAAAATAAAAAAAAAAGDQQQGSSSSASASGDTTLLQELLLQAQQLHHSIEATETEEPWTGYDGANCRRLAQQLVSFGGALCAVLPSKHCCNHTGCRNTTQLCEAELVAGKGCVCSR